MENLIINGTRVTPTIIFNTDGKLKIEGIIITENAVYTFDPIFKWIEEFKGEKIEFNINLEYMNTGASMQLYALLNKFDEDSDIKSIKIKWFYEEDDEDHLETGELFKEKLTRTDFDFISISEQEDVA